MSAPVTDRPAIGRPFTVLWAGQTASLLGSNVSAAGVSIAAFLETGSVWWLSILYLGVRLPGLLLSSFGGALVDRSDRRTVLMAADSVAGVATIGALVLLATGQLELWHLVVVAVVGATASAFQEPAYLSALPLLVPREAIGRAQGMLQMGPGLALLAGPAIAGVLLGLGGIGLVLVFDVVTFVLAILTAAATRIPRPEAAPTSGGDQLDVRGLRATWRSLDGPTRGLRNVLVYASLLNLVLSMVNVLVFALLVPLAGETGAGLLLSVGGAAMLITASVISSRGVPQRRAATITTGTAMMGVGALLTGLRPDPFLVAVGLALTLSGATIASAASGTMFQTQVPAAMQGRLTALRRVGAEAFVPFAVLAVAPLTERLAAPAMQPDGALAATVGQVLGTGDGRGEALLFVLVGCTILAIAARIRRDRTVAALDTAAATEATPRPAGTVPSPQVAPAHR